jgi:hypothetical protein
LAKDAARVSPSPWGEGRVEGDKKTLLFASGLSFVFFKGVVAPNSQLLISQPRRRLVNALF